MGWVFWLIVIVVVVAAVANSVSNMGANDAALGVKTGQSFRTPGLNYLGGHPSSPSAINACTLLITAGHVAVEKGAGLPLKLPMDKVVGLTVETEEEARRRYTATRMLALGVFALAVPKKTAGSVLITVDTDEGPVVFEKEKTTKAAVLKTLGPSIAAVSRATSKRATTPPAIAASSSPPAASVTDELTKLMALRDGGALTQAEFEEQKARVMGAGPAVPLNELVDAGDTVDLLLVDSGSRLIDVIRVVRSVTDLPLRAAKELVDTAPSVVLTQVSRDDAEHAAAQLEIAGAECQVAASG